jgi:hypothetical protein
MAADAFSFGWYFYLSHECCFSWKEPGKLTTPWQHTNLRSTVRA